MVSLRPHLVLAIVVAAAVINPAYAQDSQYSIKESEPQTGTLIPRKLVTGSRLPLNKKYNDLTADEKAVLHGFYDHISPGDEPPFPLDGLKPIYDAIAKAQARLLVRGELILIAEVDSKGEATAVKVFRSPSPEMTNFVASVLLITKFKPALCSGQPCKMDYPLMLNLNVRL